jgi:hypothetical protein
VLSSYFSIIRHLNWFKVQRCVSLCWSCPISPMIIAFAAEIMLICFFSTLPPILYFPIAIYSEMFKVLRCVSLCWSYPISATIIASESEKMPLSFSSTPPLTSAVKLSHALLETTTYQLSPSILDYPTSN